MSLLAQLAKLQRKENVNTNLDSDPGWLMIHHRCSNTKYSSCCALCKMVSYMHFIWLTIKKVMRI